MIKNRVIRITPELVKKLLPSRPKKANKTDFGRILVIAGSKGMSGAAFMSSISSLRVGGGIVYCATAETERQIIASMLPEAITIGLTSKKGYIIPEAITILKEIIKKIKFDVLIIGPGLGNNEKTGEFIIESIKTLNLPCVIDADALNYFSRNKTTLKYLNKLPHIMTPHEGEIKRIIGDNFSKRIDMALELSYISNGITVLKGYRTIITDGKSIYENTTGNVALAKAGSGDILSGIIGGLLAQKGKEKGFNNITALESAICGVWLHGKAGDIASIKLTNRCVLATDILYYLPFSFKSLISRTRCG